ncbi:hypothetical protein KEM60_02346 [Austwickia sp. TVS 96-490-7B]|uniref:FtsX-like permease family protein n=1 Tax=Austwickia sp. TVS 96-490-7B TaxID=2830843 RepID=UPI001C59C3A7|nr:FtsX-like permease family protein [Austwickia sp. TVS 96-490-7B]MBW3086135.1 hypothetical protein [Austwickia sp. TVS 96-490-7B]
MLDLAWHDAVEHRLVWIGVLLVAAAVSLFTTLCFTAMFTAAASDPAAFSTPYGRDVMLKMTSNLLFLSGIPAVLIVATVLSTLTTQLGEVHALWRLAGASPRQVIGVFTMQVVLACVTGSVVGGVIAVPFHDSAQRMMSRGSAVRLADQAGLSSVAGVLCSMLLVSLWGVLAGIRPAVRASRTSPLTGREADRSAPPSRYRAFPALLFVAFVQIPVLVPLLMSTDDMARKAPAEPALMGVVLALPAGWMLVITLALGAPLYLGPVMRLWTALPGLTRWTPWRVARHIAMSRATQSAATVIPLMMGIGMFACFDMMTTCARNITGPSGDPINVFDGVLMLTPVGVIGAIGSAAVVFMASQRRIDDVTHLRIAGASPGASMAVFLSESVIYVATAVLIALTSGVGMWALMSWSLSRWGRPVELAGLDVTGSVTVALVGGAATILIVTSCGALAWRRPLVTASAT